MEQDQIQTNDSGNSNTFTRSQEIATSLPHENAADTEDRTSDVGSASTDSCTDIEKDVPAEEEEESEARISSSDDCVILEREEGDGQESVPQRKVDDDEDKNNPQYIPKRGTFYEHDYRTTDEVADEAPKAENGTPEVENKKKIWQDKRERWGHDKFRDVEQAPKSTDELVAIYGYDIRNEDGAPRARRRRRYGRGPNKYTRNWEDEDAYYKTTSVKKYAKEPHVESVKVESTSEDAKSAVQEETSDNENQIHKEESIDVSATLNQHEKGTGRFVPNREIKNSDYKAFTKTRNFNKPSGIGEQIRTQHNENVLDMAALSLRHNDSAEYNKHRQQQSDNALKQGGMNLNQRSSTERKPSKRYSSIRQRSFPEAQNMPQHGYCHNDYNQGNLQSMPKIQPTMVAMSSTGPLPNMPPQLQPLPQQMAITNMGQFSAQFPQTQFSRSGAPAPAFLAAQSAPLVNYVPPLVPANPLSFSSAHQAPYAPYPQQFNQVAPPTELFQPQGGITYYSPEEQQTAQRHAPPMRAKAAIPILPPPSVEEYP